MKWTLIETVNEIIADGPGIDTPSGTIKVVDIDNTSEIIKSLIQVAQHPEYPAGDIPIVKEAREFLDYLYA